MLGQFDFKDIPTVNGDNTMIDFGSVPGFLSGTTGGRPAPGTGPVGRIYLDTTLNKFFRDNGTIWDDLTPVQPLTAPANQLNVVIGTTSTPTNISLASNLIMPGTEGFVPTIGTTAQRSATPPIGQSRYNSTLNRGEEFNGSNWQPNGGTVLQVITGNIAAQSGTVTVPFDNTSPTNTEGNQIWTTSFTPLSATSRIKIEFAITVAHSLANSVIVLSCFSGTTNIGATAARTTSGNLPTSMYYCKVFNSTGTASIVLSARLGSSSNGTSFCNISGTTTLGGSLVTSFSITEIQ